MLRLIPPRLHIAALRTAHALRLRWWRLTGMRVRGCRVVVLDGEDRVLLIRHTYGRDHWTLPGGGMKRGEDARLAGAREAREEAGVQVSGMVEVTLAEELFHGVINEVSVVAGWTSDAPCADGREIAEAGFFALDALPADISQRLPALLPGYVTTAKAARPG